MSAQEKAVAAFKSLPMYEAEAKERQIRKPVDNSVSQKVYEQNLNQRADQRAATAFGVNRQYIADVKAIVKAAQEKAVAAFKSLPMYEAEAKERKRIAGEMYGENHPQEVNQKVDEPLAPEPQSLQKAATAFGVNRQYIADVKAIVKAAPEKAVAAFKSLPMYEAEAKERKRIAGEMYGENHPQEVNQKVDEPLAPEPQSLQKAATAFGVNRQYIADVKAIVKAAQEKAVAAFKSLPMYEAEAKERQKAAGIERVTNADRDESGQLKQIIDEASNEPTKPEPQATQRAATAFGVNRQYIADVKAIVKAAFKSLPMYEAEAKERQRLHGGTAPGKPSETLVPKVEQVFTPAPKSIERAASAFGVGKQYIADVKAIWHFTKDRVNHLAFLSGALLLFVIVQVLPIRYPQTTINKKGTYELT